MDYLIKETGERKVLSYRIFDEDGYIIRDDADDILKQDDSLERDEDGHIILTIEQYDFYAEYFRHCEADNRAIELLARETGMDLSDIHYRVGRACESVDMADHHRVTRAVLDEIRAEVADEAE